MSLEFVPIGGAEACGIFRPSLMFPFHAAVLENTYNLVPCLTSLHSNLYANFVNIYASRAIYIFGIWKD